MDSFDEIVDNIDNMSILCNSMNTDSIIKSKKRSHANITYSLDQNTYDQILHQEKKIEIRIRNNAYFNRIVQIELD